MTQKNTVSQPMPLSELIASVKKTYNASLEYLWPDFPQTFVFRHASSRKWFGVVMDVERSKLGLAGVIKAWHMNKNHWLGILLDGSAAEQTMKELLDVSYSLTE